MEDKSKEIISMDAPLGSGMSMFSVYLAYQYWLRTGNPTVFCDSEIGKRELRRYLRGSLVDTEAG